MNEYKLTMLYKQGLDYKTRNFIVLMVLLVLTILTSILMQRSLSVQHTELQKEKTALNSQLQNIMMQLNQSAQARERLEKLQEELFLTDKVMPNINNTTITLSHIFGIFRKYQNYFPFDFRHVSSGRVERDQQVLFNRYTISGKAYINLLFSFIDQFERQLSFYTIEAIELSSLSAEEQGKINFSITFNAYHTSTGTPYQDIALKNLEKRHLPYNIFYPRIYETYARESDEEYADVSELSVIGITPNQVFFRNSRTGIVAAYEEGSRVKYGRLHSIDWDRQEVVFRLNKTGLLEEHRIKVAQRVR